MSTKTIHLVAGARPNFMKVGPLYHWLARSAWATPVLVHTGQHFSADMSDVFMRDLELPEPHVHLGAEGTTHATQTASVMVAYEAACTAAPPDAVVVVGDVNSTLAACVAAKKLNLFVAHLEAGLRSGDRSMPEELNRLMVDAIADLLWTPSPDADANLQREGVPAGRIERVGNIMIDAYCALEHRIAASAMAERIGLTTQPFVVVTLHRPANVDRPEPLAVIVRELIALQRRVQVVFPVHPRTAQRLRDAGHRPVLEDAGVRLLGPLSYLEFMSLVRASVGVVTDSGGVQEETSYLGIRCFTVRDTTERPITVTAGTNQLVQPSAIFSTVIESLHVPLERKAIALWDGHTAERVAASLQNHLS